MAGKAKPSSCTTCRRLRVCWFIEGGSLEERVARPGGSLTGSREQPQRFPRITSAMSQVLAQWGTMIRQYEAGDRIYELVEGWGQLPDGWRWGQVAGVACDSRNYVHVYTRTEHPYMVFDPNGKMVDH